MKCPLCESENHSIITTRRSVPVLQNVLCDTEQKAFQIPRGDIELYVCHDCNFVFNAAYKQVNYESNYENFQGCSSIFDSYLESRAKKIVNFILRQKRPILLMEIGCGQGDFLSRVMKCVPQDIPISAIGFDPAYDADRSSVADSRCLFFSQYFDAKSVDTKFKKLYPIKICISRHVIEHIPNPHFLFECLSQLDGEVYLFLETPDVHWILSHGAFEDIVYEHCSFYSPESMCYLLQKYGFFLTSLNLTFNNQYMWIQAEKITKKYVTYHDMEKELIYKWSLLNKFPPGGGVFLWGAGAKCVAFLQLLDPLRKYITKIIDINPKKQGMFIAGSGHEIVAPEYLKKINEKIYLIVMNENYLEEIKECVSRMGINQVSYMTLHE